MRILVFSIIILTIAAAACSISAKDEGETIVTVHAEIVEYRSMAMHFDYDDGTAEWKDAVHLKIVYPPGWKEGDLRILCAREPDNSPWRKVGNVYEFAIAAKYLAGLNPEGNIKHAFLGDIKGEIKLVKKGKK